MKRTDPTSNKQGQRLIITITAIFLGIMLAATLPGCKKEKKKEAKPIVKPVKIMTVKSSSQPKTITLPGRVRAAKRSELSFKVSGPLYRLPIEEGQVVKKGDLIAQILPRDFQVALDAAKARKVEAENQYNRYKELYARRQVAKAEFDRYKAARDIARAELEDAENARLDSSLRAPYDGVIAKRYVENFEKVQAKQPIALLQSIEQLEILVDVPELIMASLRKNSDPKIAVSFDAIPGMKFPIKIKEFSTQADLATGTYQVVFSMEQPQEATILPGMTAQVSGSTAGSADGTDIIKIPAIVVMNGADKASYVWQFKPESKTVHKIQIEIGSIEGSSDIIVKKGLQGGETLVIAGLTKLSEGMQVRPWEKQREVQ
jgi:RND family efflux transporter MFP subunit